MTRAPRNVGATSTDGELLCQLAERDARALEVLYARYSAYVMGISLRIMQNREEAEEVVQDVFWQLWKAELAYDPTRGRFSTWLFSVARFRCLDRLRSRERSLPRAPVFAPDSRESAPDQEAEAYLLEKQKEVRASLERLPAEQRAAIELAFFAGLTHDEIAARTGEALGTVKSRIRRGLARMRGALAAVGTDRGEST